MFTLACAVIGGGIGALIGAGIQSTEKGQKMNDAMVDGWNRWNDDVKDKIPWDKVGDYLEKTEDEDLEMDD